MDYQDKNTYFKAGVILSLECKYKLYIQTKVFKLIKNYIFLVSTCQDIIAVEGLAKIFTTYRIFFYSKKSCGVSATLDFARIYYVYYSCDFLYLLKKLISLRNSSRKQMLNYLCNFKFGRNNLQILFFQNKIKKWLFFLKSCILEFYYSNYLEFYFNFIQ